MTFAIAAAGTGGHLYPALAVADSLVEAGVSSDDVVFVGGDRLEATVVPAAGYQLIQVEVRGLRRSLSPAALASNLALPLVVARARRALRSRLAGRNVTVLLAMGGYVTVPAVLAARANRTTVVLHEQNAEPGLANRLMARFADEVLIGFPAARSRLPGAREVGNPVRRELAEFDRARLRSAARQRYDVAGEVVVVGVLGGSLGAEAINHRVEALAHALAAEGDTAIVHLTGPDHADTWRQVAAGSPVPWRVVPFEESMQFFYAAADVVVCRAGAGTVAELAVTSTPAVMVPLEAVAQQANADHLVARGAAELVRESELARLPATVAALVGDGSRRRSMAAAAAAVARPEAAAEVAAVLREAAGA